ncbi:MAG: ATP-dependent RNA helicase DbpA [Pseudohongiellaceae bacterium]
MSQSAFASLDLSTALLANLESLAYYDMTPIQARSLPPALAGIDVIAQAKTGSGKTAAFALPLLQKLDVQSFQVQSLVLCPTRELADQVAGELRRLARGMPNVKVLTLCGGMPFGPQLGSLEHGAHIVVGTPGRIEEHLRKGSLILKKLGTFVLDEADRMLDMGFQEALDAIVAYLPAPRQTLLFSATFPAQIQSVAERILVDPVMVKVDASHDSDSIRQYFYQVENDAARLPALRLLLLRYRPDSTLIFCNTRRETEAVATALRAFGFSVLALHGDLEQKDRERILVCFANKSASILVATDVAARGLDIDALDAVINFHLSRDLEVHTHRVGRTGRAGSSGIACSLFTEKEQFRFAALEKYLQQTLPITPLPEAAVLKQPTFKPPMETLQIDGGKKQKVRPGDILGALTGSQEIRAEDVGKIHIFANHAYVAVKRDIAAIAEAKIRHDKLKGRSFRVRNIRTV